MGFFSNMFGVGDTGIDKELLKKAEDGDAEAQWSLGFKYYQGEEVSQNYKKAFSWYTKSANQGYSLAQTSLGTSYLYGHGVPQNHEKALEWLIKAAKQGEPFALVVLQKVYNINQ